MSEECFAGFRCESYGGMYERDLLEVAHFEIDELTNEDIIDYCIKHYGIKGGQDIFEFLGVLVKEGFDSCTWLCDTEDDVREYYGDNVGRYEFPAGTFKVISDLGPDGKLVAYKSSNAGEIGISRLS